MHGRDSHGIHASAASVAKIPYRDAEDGISLTSTIVPQGLGRQSEERVNNLTSILDGFFGSTGYLQPVNDTAHGETCGTPCPMSVFKSGQTIPFKFQLSDCAGQPVPGAGAWIEVLFYADGVVGTKVKDITSSGQANTDDLYRYDASGRRYIYNLSTFPLSVNTTYLVRTHISDGTTHDVLISIVR